MANEADFAKIAAALGRQEFEKEAFGGAIVKGIGSLGARALGGAEKFLTGGKAIKDLSGFQKTLGKGVRRVKQLSRGASGDVALFGGLGAGLGALGNPEDRLGGAMKGLLGGAAGGLGWRMGMRGAQGIVRRTAGGKKMLREAARGKKYRNKAVNPLTLSHKEMAAKARAQGRMTRKETSRLRKEEAVMGPTPKNIRGVPSESTLAKRKVPMMKRWFGDPKDLGYRQWYRRFSHKGMKPADVAKYWGGRAAMGAVPLAGGMYAAGAFEEPFHGGEQAQAPQQQYYDPRYYGGY